MRKAPHFDTLASKGKRGRVGGGLNLDPFWLGDRRSSIIVISVIDDAPGSLLRCKTGSPKGPGWIRNWSRDGYRGGMSGHYY